MRQRVSKRKSFHHIAALAISAGALPSMTSAGTVTWDGGGGVSSWLEPTNWAPDAAPQANDVLVFAGTTGLATNNDFAANTQFNGLQFAVGAGAFTLAGNAINLGGDIVGLTANSVTISTDLALLQDTTISAAGTMTLSGVVSGGFGITKVGGGTASINKQATFTGPINVRQGGLTLNLDAAAVSTNVVSSALTVTMGSTLTTGATLTARGRSNTASTQAVAATELAGGQVNFTVTKTGTGTMSLDLGTVTRSGRSTASFSNLLGTANDGTIVAAGLANDASGILGGWATYGSNWAMVNGSNQVVANSTYTVVPSDVVAITSGATTNVQISNSSAGNITLATAGTTDINTLQVTDTIDRTLDLGGNTLRLGASGAVWRLGPTSTTTGTLFNINNGVLTAGGAPDIGGELILNAGTRSTTNGHRLSGGISVGAAINNNGTGVVTLVKTGVQPVVLNTAGDYSGGTYVHQGVLRANIAGAMGSGTVYVLDDRAANTGAALWIGSATISNPVVIGGNGTHDQTVALGAMRLFGGTAAGPITLIGNTLITSSGAATAVNGTVSGKITGSYGVTWGQQFSTNGILIVSNNANDYTGDTTVTMNGSGSTHQVVLRLGASGVIPDGAGKGNLIIDKSGSGGSATLRLNGFDETVNGLFSTGSSAGGRTIENGGGGNVILTVGAGDAAGNYAGVLANGTSGTLGLAKMGAGTQILSGSNTYTGVTTLKGGVLSIATVANGGTASNIGQATSLATNLVFDGGTLRYTGAGASTNRNFTINNSKTAVFDVTANTLTVTGGAAASTGSLSKVGDGTLVLTAANAHTGGTSVADGSLIVSSAGTLGGGDVAVAGGATLQLQGSSIIDDLATVDLATGALLVLDAGVNETVAGLILNGAGFGVGTYGSTASAADTKDDSFFGGTGIVTVAAVPEPAGLAGVILGAGLLLRRRRRA